MPARITEPHTRWLRLSNHWGAFRRDFRSLLVRSRRWVIQKRLGAWFVGGATVRCSKCGTNNPSTNNFCAKCGNALARHCAKCKAENPPTSDFCGKCGAPLTNAAGTAGAISSPQALASDVRVTPEQPDASTPIEGERKTVTALFADSKGSMELMEDLDPEEARAIIDPALRLMIDAVRRYDGYVVQSTGDG